MSRKSAYTQEFQDNAVKRVVADGRGVGLVAKELGIPRSMLQSWVHKHRRDVKLAKDGSQESYVQELLELRKENAELREANDILKKAAAYFAKSL